MRNFKDTHTALASFEEAAEKHAMAMETGNYKAANKNYDIITSTVNFFRAQNIIENLYPLLSHNSVGVRSAAAAYLLEVHEKEAVEVLEQIKDGENGIHSLNAEMTLEEWRNGNLKL